MSDRPPEDWIDIRDDDGRLLCRWSPRLGMLEFMVRVREKGGTRHRPERRIVALPAPDAQAVDSAMSVVV